MRHDHPNILVITVDTLRHDAIGVVNPVVKTPHIDALAAAGAIFTRAYCASPECGPSRASMLTGLPPHRHGQFANCRISLDGVYHADQSYTVRDGVPKLADMLGEHGYEELHLAGWPGNCVYVDDAYRAVLKERGFGHVEAPRGRPDAGMYYLPQPSPLPEDLHLSHRQADLIIDTLDAWRRSPAGPFLLETTFNKPHPPLDPPGPYAAMYDPGRIELPARGEDYDPERWPFYHLWQNSFKAPWGRTPPFLNRMQLAAYYGSVSFVDRQIGRIMEFLAACGLREDTIVVVTGDHGCMMGDHCLFGKRSWYDGAARVPLVISAPSGLPAGTRSDEMVSHLDLLPTMFDLAGLPVARDSLPGASLVGPDASREMLFGQYGEKIMAVYMAMDRRYKYTYFAADEMAMLFDYRQDPRELRDVSADPAHAAAGRRLKRALIEYFRTEGYLDPIDGDSFRRYPPPPEYAATRRRCVATALQR